MELDPRKLRILAAITETYIRTGEPVGSKLLSLYPDRKCNTSELQ